MPSNLEYKARKSQNVNSSHLVLHLPLPIPLKSGVKSVENEDVVGAAPTGDAPTTSEWSTKLLPTKVRLIWEVWRCVIFSWCLPYLHLYLSISDTGNQMCWASCCYAYYVIQLWRHQHVPWFNIFFLTTIGSVALGANWSQVLAWDWFNSVDLDLFRTRLIKKCTGKQKGETC